MSENPDRDGVIELLGKLGDPDDAEALAAARKLHEQISGAGLTWDDLLIPEEGATVSGASIVADDDDDYDDVEDADDGDPGPAADDGEAVATGEAATDLKLIERLLSGKEVSSSLREELEGYKEDIKEGEFTTSDRRYLEALDKRLSGTSKSRAKD